MEILEINELEDGSATYDLQFGDKREIRLTFEAGMEYLRELKAAGKIDKMKEELAYQPSNRVTMRVIGVGINRILAKFIYSYQDNGSGI